MIGGGGRLEEVLGEALDRAIRDNDEFKALVATVAEGELPSLEALFEVAGTIVGLTAQHLVDVDWVPRAEHEAALAAREACIKRLREGWEPCPKHADMWADRLLVKHEPMTPAEQEVMSR